MDTSRKKKDKSEPKEVFLPWLIERRVQFFFVFLVVFLFLLLINQGGGSDLKRAPIWALKGFSFLALLFFFLLEYARPGVKGLPLPTSRQPLFKYIAIYTVVFLVINILAATSWQDALSESLTFLMILAVMSLVSYYADTKERVGYVILSLAALGLYTILHGLIAYFLRDPKTPLDSFFAWHNPAGGYFAAILIIFLTYQLSESLSTPLGRFGWIGSICAFTALIFTLSRGAWVAAFLGGLFLLILLGIKKAYNKSSVIIAIGLFVLVIIVAGIVGGKSFLEPVYHRIISFTATKDFSMEGRENFYTGAVEIFKDNTTTGIGLGSYGYVYPQYQNDPRFYARDPHSFYLRLMCEGGLFGVVIILMIIFGYIYLLIKFIRNRDKSISVKSAALIGALTAGLLHLAIDFDDTFPFILLNLGIIWILALNLLDPVFEPVNADHDDEAKPSIRTSMAGISVILTLVLLSGIVHCGRMYYSEIYYSIGDQYAADEDWANAEEGFASALRYYPNHVRALTERSRALLFLHGEEVMLGDASASELDILLKKALLSSSKLKAAAPYSAKSFYLSGLGLLRSDDPENMRQAVKDFETALKKDPVNSPRFYFDAISTYWNFGLTSEFYSTVEKFKNTFPYERVEEYARTRLDWDDLPQIYQDILSSETQILILLDEKGAARENLEKILDLEKVKKNIFGDEYIKNQGFIDSIYSLLEEIDTISTE